MDKLAEAREIINGADREMAALFARRMEAVKAVAAYKKEKGMPILDAAREEEVLRRNAALISDEDLRRYYLSFLRHLMELSREYQRALIE